MKGPHAQYALPLVALGVLGLGLGLSLPPASAASAARMSTGEALFRAANPCPSTGLVPGPCKGYAIDRVIPRLCGGADTPENMRWLPLAEAKAKARWDRIGCRGGRKLVLPGESTSTTEAFPMSNAPEPVRSLPLRPGERAPASTEPVVSPAAAPEESDDGELPHD